MEIPSGFGQWTTTFNHYSDSTSSESEPDSDSSSDEAPQTTTQTRRFVRSNSSSDIESSETRNVEAGNRTQVLQDRIENMRSNAIEPEQIRDSGPCEFLCGYLDTAVSFISHVFSWIAKVICCCWSASSEEVAFAEEIRVRNYLEFQLYDATAEEKATRYRALPEDAKRLIREKVFAQDYISLQSTLEHSDLQWIEQVDHFILEFPSQNESDVRGGLQEWLNARAQNSQI